MTTSIPFPKKRMTAVFLAVAALFGLSTAGSFLMLRPRDRRIFFFPSGNGALYAEARSLTRKAGDAAFSQYVEEILLGPESSRCLPLFSPGTRVISCFARGKTLYIDLSREALFAEKGACPVKEGAELLKKNIAENFRDLTEVRLYINGEAAYEEFD
jgi:hypothetical protein